jgi:hypothetical protein
MHEEATGMSTDKDAGNRPAPARRALLTGGAVGLAAMAGATLGRVQPASAASDLADVQWIVPSGVAATDTSNINNQLSTVGVAWLAPGQFYIQEEKAGTPAITVPPQGMLIGSGAGQTNPDATVGTVLNYIGASTCIYFHDTTKGDGSNDQLNRMGIMRDFAVDGTNAVTTGLVIGIDCGDGWGGRIDHVYVDNFSGTAGTIGTSGTGGTGQVNGSIGWYINNEYYFTEKWNFTNCHARGNTNNIVMDSTVGVNDISHGYNYFDFHMHTVVGAHGLVIKSGVNVYHSQLFLRGNNDAATGTTAPVISLIGSDTSGGGTDYSQIVQSHINICFETNSGSNGPVSIHFASPSSTGNQIVNCYGIISMTGAYQSANAATGCFSFGGVLQVSNDTTLSSVNVAPKGWL